MWHRIVVFVALIALAVGGVVAFSDSTAVASQPWRAKVDDSLLAEAEVDDETTFLVVLAAQAHLRDAPRLATKAARGEFVFERLTAVANRTQPPLRRFLAQRGASFQSFWIVNMLAVRGDAALIEALAQRDDVARIAPNRASRLDGPVDTVETAVPLAVQAVEWGLRKVNADDVWALGYTGQGVVVAGQDTGYEWDHSALKQQYRGWDSGTSTASHDYNWHDAIHAIDSNNSGPNPCGLDSPEPCDDNNHGTHTMGTIVGDDGAANQIGMAPGAAWIACRNMERGYGTPATYAECFEWFIAPTDINGANPDTSKAPHVINNSWGCPPSEGCTDPTILQQVVENTRAAGIVVVVSAGNEGSACSTVANPAAIYDAAFSVAATDTNDSAASFSSRGPVTVDGSNRFKPDIAGPGVFVRSSVRGDSYGTSSGTSMAGPHVAGLVALLISADPSLAGEVDKLEQIVRNTAVPLTTTQECGGLPGTHSPNHTFGYGRIDALAAVNYALNPPAAAAPDVAPASANSGDDVTLGWAYSRDNCRYVIHRSTGPYFTPDAGSELAQVWGDVTAYSDADAGKQEGAYFYVVTAVSCDDTSTANSNRSGAFTFALE